MFGSSVGVPGWLERLSLLSSTARAAYSSHTPLRSQDRTGGAATTPRFEECKGGAQSARITTPPQHLRVRELKRAPRGCPTSAVVLFPTADRHQSSNRC